MSFNQLIQLNALDLIGGQPNLANMLYLENLSNTANQMSLKSSKPFQVKGDVLTPTAALIQLDGVIKNTLQMIQSGFTPPNELHTSPYVLNKAAGILLLKTYYIAQQRQWFDLLAINHHPNKVQMLSSLLQLWNEIRGYSMSAEAEKEAKSRSKLITEQRNENSRIVSRLLTEHTNIQMSKISYPFVIACNTQQLDMSKVEKALVKLKSKMVDQLQQLNGGNLLCLQWRIQQTISGQYYVNFLLYHSEQQPLQLPQDQDLLSHSFTEAEQQTIKLDLSSVLTQIIKIERDNFQGINLEQWKVIFNSMLYPLKYYYYQSKVISAKFEHIIY
ncbi:hypothetical protein [Acinetobacter sp. SWAC57]|uniref:hypothetical protein n=1 Tax=Acinetobacter sp. SWAC57 TaxID=2293834 RepID=UPI000E5BE365|nr:hypothetical protein [Acinetobacter sp. SWAC57]RGD92581.1 hypothetical protein DYI96_04445 [Acinetobacter sp. SWAC57]